MPVTKTAKRALRSSRRKAVVNKQRVTSMEIAIRILRKKPTKKNLSEAFSKIDRAVKNKILPRQRAGRLKSQLTKLVDKKVRKNTSSKTDKKGS